MLLRRTNVGQAFRLSGTTFVKMVGIQLVNPSFVAGVANLMQKIRTIYIHTDTLSTYPLPNVSFW